MTTSLIGCLIMRADDLRVNAHFAALRLSSLPAQTKRQTEIAMARQVRIEGIIHPDQRAAAIKAFVNPSAVNLASAENVLLLPWLQQNAFADLPVLTAATARYPNAVPNGEPYNGGSAAFIDSVAAFLSHEWNVTVDADSVYGSSGVLPALGVIALVLFNPGDRVIAPAPAFYGFPMAFCQKASAMQFETFLIDNETTLTLANVEAALRRCPDAKVLVLTNPNNPLGASYSRELLESIYSFFLSDPSRHIISDEIYACSRAGTNAFVSALSLDAYRRHPQRIHVTWGLSKDFGLAGFRAGFIISANTDLQAALAGGQCGPVPSWYFSESWSAPITNPNPYLLQRLFLDGGRPNPSLAIEAMAVYRGLLRRQYETTAQLMTRGRIPYVQPNTDALFFWIDLRKYLDLVPHDVMPWAPLCASLYPNDDVREARLGAYLQNAGLILIRGQECFNTTPGFFRLCYTAADMTEVAIGIASMVAALEKLG